jgi:hypothetical protein
MEFFAKNVKKTFFALAAAAARASCGTHILLNYTGRRAA